MKQNEPMWVDESEVARTPLTPEETKSLRKGDVVRLVDENGRTAQGAIQGVAGYSAENVRIGGASFPVRAHTVYRLDSDEGHTEVLPARIKPTIDELRDLVVDLIGSELTSLGKATVIGTDDIVRRMLGYDPSTGKPAAAYGGKSKDGWINEHFSLAQTKKLLRELVDAGVLRSVVEGRYNKPSDDAKYCTFPYRLLSGWTTVDMYEAAKAAHDTKKDAARRERLMQEARLIVAGRHADEVGAEFRRLLAND